MKRHRIVKCLVIVLAVSAFVKPALAILGIGDIVYDPTNYAQALQRFAQLQQQYAQLVQTYVMIQNQYRQMLFMAQQVPVNMSARYRALPTPWRNSAATNTYGTTSGWVTGINTGSGVTSGYSVATQPLQSYSAALSNIPADQLSRVKTNYATVELTDGANIYGMTTIGQMRANSSAVELAIKGLEDDSLSSNPDMNTEIAVLNKINAAHLITVRNTQDTNKLLVALAEQQIIDGKRKRDAETQAINNHIRFMAEGKAVMAAQASGASQAMLAWRMP
jgi:type IV secretion system protein TrbJ